MTVLTPYPKRQNAPRATSPLIIQIGFNRCGTLSFHRMMKDNGIPALHWQEPGGRNVAQTMLNNLSFGRKPFDGFDGLLAFSDISFLNGQIMIEGGRLFRTLHAAYPDAYFFFNTRDKSDWIASRAAHANGTFLKRFCKMSGLDEAGAKAAWGEMFDQHTAEVQSYFATATARFLRFDLDQDGPEKIADWLAPDYTIDTAHWGHYNKNSRSRDMRVLEGQGALG
ncbi:sulfotransferase [Celeribacter sp.]|uniref:sulfotransferase n=1 Tax=Celeribacter sp. TaxID=1890673 RepID=UPI003A8CEC72